MRLDDGVRYDEVLVLCTDVYFAYADNTLLKKNVKHQRTLEQQNYLISQTSTCRFVQSSGKLHLRPYENRKGGFLKSDILLLKRPLMLTFFFQ